MSSLSQQLLSNPFLSFNALERTLAPQATTSSPNNLLETYTQLYKDPDFLTQFRQLHPNHTRLFRQLIQAEGNKLTELFANRYTGPSELELHPSEFCPLNCHYCVSPNSYTIDQVYQNSIQTHGRVSAQQWCDFIGWGAQRGTNIVQISGGREPATYKELPKLVEYARTLNLHTRLNTSGTFPLTHQSIDYQVAQYLNHFQYICISAEAATPLKYDQYKGTGTQRWFHRLLEALAAIGRYQKLHAAQITPRPSDAHIQDILKLAHVEIGVLLIDQTLEELDQLVATFSALANVTFRFRRLKDPTTLEFTPLPQQVTLDALYTLAAKWHAQDVFIYFNKEDFSNQYSQQAFEVTPTRAWCGLRKWVANPAGDLFLCAAQAYANPNADARPTVNLLSTPNLAQAMLNASTHVHGHYHIADIYVNAFIEKLYLDYQRGITLAQQPIP